MSTVIKAAPSQTSDELPPFPVHRFSVAEYEELTRLGILTEDSNVELLDGWIVPKMPKNPSHDGTIDFLLVTLTKLLPNGWYPRGQNVLITADSAPEPDIAVVRGQPGDYREKHPTGSDVELIIEVAESSVRRDRAKAAIYARAGIPQYWIINLDDGQIEVFSRPTGKGRKRVYQSSEVLDQGAELKVVLDGRTAGKLKAREILG